MYNSVLPIAVGRADSGTWLGSSLGDTFAADGKVYRLVRTSTAVAASPSKVLVSAVTAGALTWLVTTSTTANDATVIGVVPTGQTGSDGTSGLVSGDYFLIQVAGLCDVLSNAAIALNVPLYTSSTAGSAGSIAASADSGPATQLQGAFAISLETAAGAAEFTGCRLRNLI